MLHDSALTPTIDNHLIEWLLPSYALVKPLYPAHRKIIVMHVNAEMGHSDSLGIFILYTKVIFVKVLEAIWLRFLWLIAGGNQVSVLVICCLDATDCYERSLCNVELE